jgi:hypothetical protein
MTLTPTANDRDRNPCTRDVATSPTKLKRDERAQAACPDPLLEPPSPCGRLTGAQRW